MKKIILFTCLLLSMLVAFAQQPKQTAAVQPFKGYFYNKEYNIYIRLNPYESDIIVPNQEIFGAMAGFLGDNQDARKWLFTAASQKTPTTLLLDVINDYGSEDLKASFKSTNDTTFVLKQLDGSVIKIVRNRKWVKLPKELTFIKH